MKKSDVMVVVFIATVGIVIAYLVCNALMPAIEPVSFKTIEPVTAELATPNSEVFNSAALNPTVETYVGSCVDQDQNGELNLAESVLCHETGNEMEEEDSQSAEDVINQIDGD